MNDSILLSKRKAVRAQAILKLRPEYRTRCRVTIHAFNEAKKSEEGSQLTLLGLRIQLQNRRHEFARAVAKGSY